MKSLSDENIRLLYQACQFRPPLLFLGAGFSIEAGYSSTSNVIKELRSVVDKQLTPNKSGASGLSLSRLATLYASKIGEDALNDLLRRKFGNAPTKIPRSYPIIRSHLEFNPVITTNFDDGLGSYLRIPPTFDYSYFARRYKPSDGERVLLHLHGHAHWLGSHRVLTTRDYANFYRMPDVDLLVQEIVTLIQTRTLVFVGYSLGDENIVRLFALLQQGRSQQVTAWLVSPDASKVADENQSLGVNFRPVNLRSSPFFRAYSDIAQNVKRRPRESHFTGGIRIKRRPGEVLLTRLLEVLDNGLVAEELLSVVFDGSTSDATHIEIPVSPGNHNLLIVPNIDASGFPQAFTVVYDTAEARFDLASNSIATAGWKLAQMLPPDCRFGLAFPTCPKWKGVQ
jgi:SIR2-like protein